MQRQETLRSSSSRHETMSENHHAKAIGCMSGIFRLVSKYQNRRKFLTFGRKQGKNTVTMKAKPLVGTQLSSLPVQGDKKRVGDSTCTVRRFSCDMPRSPTLPAAIRRSNSDNSPENFRTPPALVARLMGLNDIPASSSSSASASEKRRKLLGALEKCDEDLKALKNIIDAVRSAEQLRSSGVVKSVNVEGEVNQWSTKCKQYISGEAGDGDIMKKVKRCWDSSGEQPSPVSVLDEFTRSSPLSDYARRYTNGRVMHQQKQQQRKKPGEEDNINLRIFHRSTTESFQTKCENAASPLWSSKAMIESVDEACRDIAWGERREVGRIGLALQEYICRDLIEEIVKEMECCSMYSLPFEACKRRLCF